MKRLIISLILCSALIISAAGCAGTSKSDPAASPEAAAEDTAAADDGTAAGDAAAADDGAAADDAAAADADAAAEAGAAAEADAAADAAAPAESAAENMTAPAASASGTDEYDAEYAFVHVKFDGTNTIVIPNGTVNDDTVLYNDKTLGGLCDYIDSEVLEDGRTINRDFLYGLVAVEIVDPKLFASYEPFSMAMIYSLTIANEFYGTDVSLTDMILDSTENTKQSFEVVAEGKEDTWILDGHEKKFYLNNGSTEYTSTMFDAETMAVWSIVLDEYFGVSSETNTP